MIQTVTFTVTLPSKAILALAEWKATPYNRVESIQFLGDETRVKNILKGIGAFDWIYPSTERLLELSKVFPELRLLPYEV